MTHALVRLADGDRTAFETVYREAQPRVHALVRRMCPGDPDVDDVAQQALLKVFERASDYDADIGPALPWILGIAAWTVRSHRKTRLRRREVEFEGERSCEAPLEQSLITRDLEAACREVLGTLNERDRQTLEHAMSGGSGNATFRKRLQRAMERFRAAFRRAHE